MVVGCPSDAGSHGIKSHGTDLVVPKYCSFRTRRVNPLSLSAAYRHQQTSPSLLPVWCQAIISSKWCLGNKFMSNLNQNTAMLFTQENAFKMLSAKCWPLCLSLNVRIRQAGTKWLMSHGQNFQTNFHTWVLNLMEKLFNYKLHFGAIKLLQVFYTYHNKESSQLCTKFVRQSYCNTDLSQQWLR